MKKINLIYIKLLLLTIFVSGCSLDEEFYSQIKREDFFKTQESVLQSLNRPFTHLRWFLGDGAQRWQMQEFTGDAFCLSTKGPHWYNGGLYERLQYHSWTEDDGPIYDCWYGATMGIALAIASKEDIGTYADYDFLLFPEGTKEMHMAQLDVLQAYFYLRGLDYFGGLPIYKSTNDELKPRSTDIETFELIENFLSNEQISKLPKKTELSAQEIGVINQAAAAMMKAQLYFNAESYIGKKMYTECAKICEDILKGTYGQYGLDATWHGAHNFFNDKSPEMIWNIPCQYRKLEVYNFMWTDGYHYNSSQYFDLDGGANNGCHLQPSRKPTGEIYTEFKLGKPYEKFHDKDLRKKAYRYFGSGAYEGMFLVGDQINNKTGAKCLGTEEYKDKLISFVDQIARFSEVGPNKKYSSIDKLPSKISEGEENSGIRFVKYPRPNMADQIMRNNPDLPIYRLAEVYYMLAECKLRAGDKAGAASLINDVRKRNFENGIDPDPVTAGNLDKYRMLDEWQVEFLGEQRRRTDLIRWDAFVTEKWWDHEPKNNKNLHRFPVPSKAMSANNLLKQNPGY